MKGLLALACAVAMLVGGTPALADVGEVVVMPPVAHSAPLFDAELEPIQSAVATFLKNNGYALAPVGIVTRAVAFSAEGRLDGLGPVCAVAPTVSEVLSRDPATETRATIEVGWLCNPGPGGCRWADTLRVVLIGPGEEGDVRPLRHWRADVRDHSPAGWAAAAEKLTGYTPSRQAHDAAAKKKNKKGSTGLKVSARVTFEPGKAPSGRGTDSPKALESLDSVFTVGKSAEPAAAPDDKEADREKRRVAKAEKKEAKVLAKCFRPTVGARGSAVLSVDASGRVTKCEARHEGWMAAGDRVDTCLCRRLSGRVYPEGAADRRVVVDVTNTRREPKKAKTRKGDVLLANVRVESVESEPGFQGDHLVHAAAERLAYCASPRGVPANIDIMWRVRANGNAGEPLIAVDGPMPDNTRRCIERQIADVAFPCTDTGKTARVRLKAILERVKEPAQAAKVPF